MATKRQAYTFAQNIDPSAWPSSHTVRSPEIRLVVQLVLHKVLGDVGPAGDFVRFGRSIAFAPFGQGRKAWCDTLERALLAEKLIRHECKGRQQIIYTNITSRCREL